MDHTISLALSRPDYSYDISVGSGLLSSISQFIPSKTSQVLLISHRHLFDLYGDTIQRQVSDLGIMVRQYYLDVGEKAKSWDNAEEVLSQMIEWGMDRNTLIIALGGGVVGDFSGFVAALFQRGVKFIQIPTSLLSMVDSSVGGKTAVNLTGLGKNLIGAFHQPHHVIIDMDTLCSLPEIEWVNGLGEVLKYAFLRDDGGKFFGWLEQHRESLYKRPSLESSDWQLIAQMILLSVQTKADIVQQDETERTGLRALLNLGHTFGHAFEALSDYGLPHGQGVSIGINYAFQLSERLGFITSASKKQVIDLIQSYDLPISLPKEYKFTPEQVFEYFKYDKKTQNNELRFVLPKGNISHCEVVSLDPPGIVLDILRENI